MTQPGLRSVIGFALLVACSSAPKTNLFSDQHPSGGTSSGGVTSSGGTSNPSGGSSGVIETGGTPSVGGASGNAGARATGGSGTGGSNSGGTGGSNSGGTGGVIGTGGATCAATDWCDGLDHNCDGHFNAAVCPSHCRGVARGDTGYMFCASNTLTVTWAQARTSCEAQGMHLVWIDNAQEDAFVAQNLVAAAGSTTWIGADDIVTEGTWFWDGGANFWLGGPAPDGAPVDGRYSNWDAGKPNNLNNEDCAILGASGSGTNLSYSWNDIACDLGMHAFVCEDF